MMILQNCDAERACVSNDLFNMCFKKSCFRDCLKISSLISFWENDWRGLQQKTSTIYADGTTWYSKFWWDFWFVVVVLRWLLNFNLTLKTLWIRVGSGLLVSKLRKLSFLLDHSNNCLLYNDNLNIVSETSSSL